MTTFVVDASAYIYATTSTEPAARTVLKRIMDADCHAPHLLDAEVGNVLRRLELRGDIQPETALSSRKSLKHMGTRGIQPWTRLVTRPGNSVQHHLLRRSVRGSRQCHRGAVADRGHPAEPGARIAV